jgi:cell division GTPase FtsZ
MKKSKLKGVEYIACNTDIQSLNYSGADKLIQLGKVSTKGF